jgi:hypothetical protein
MSTRNTSHMKGEQHKTTHRHRSDEEIFNFDHLKLVDKPDSKLNSPDLPQTLEDCEGYLKCLPLVAPNADKNPVTVANMVNLLTLLEAQESFDKAKANLEENDAPSGSGLPSVVYNEKTSVAMKQLLRMANENTSHMHAPGIMGHVVQPGCISFYNRDGKTYAVSEGRWMLTSIKAKWIAKNVSVNQDRIHFNGGNSNVLIIRVKPGEVALIRDLGVEILLDVGLHVFNSGTISYVDTKVYSETTYFRHGRYHYIRIPRGMFGKVWAEVRGNNGVTSVVARLLAQGEHYVDNHLFQHVGFVDCSLDYIPHGSVHYISVEKGFVAKALQDNQPRLLGEGHHIIESTDFEFSGTVPVMSSPCIVHGTITILRVNLGKVALAWYDSQPVMIDEPGLYEYDSPDFEFVEFKDAEERLIQLGAKKIVLVQTGEVGVTYDQGLLKILPHGIHKINSSTHIFHRFLSTQQKSIRLATLNIDEKIWRASRAKKSKAGTLVEDHNFGGRKHSDQDSDLTVCETKDLVKVGLRADVFYSIEDPMKCINKIDTDELEDLVRETAVATLTNIIRSTALNEIAQSKQVSAGGKGGIEILQPPGTASSAIAMATPAPMFFEKAHDDFLNKLHDDFMERYGGKYLIHLLSYMMKDRSADICIVQLMSQISESSPSRSWTTSFPIRSASMLSPPPRLRMKWRTSR